LRCSRWRWLTTIGSGWFEVNMHRAPSSYVIERDNNVVRVDFWRKPEPPAPKFPGAGALRELSIDQSEPLPACRAA
jgi:hypothetical protein